MKVTTHELRFTSTGEGDLEWIAGVYHSKFDEVMNGYLHLVVRYGRRMVGR